MLVDDAVLQLVARWRGGDQDAAGELYQQYGTRLIALARSRLSSKLAQRIDPEDVVQSACRSFFVGTRAGRYDLQCGADLWQLLVVTTLHKLNDQIKHHFAQKRSVAGEQRFGSEDSLVGIQAAALRQPPTPAEAAALVDEVEQVMRQLTPLQRQMLEMRLQGHNLDEIAVATGRCPLTVRRTLGRIKQDVGQRGLPALGT